MSPSNVELSSFALNAQVEAWLGARNIVLCFRSHSLDP
jgi:hypothetical protein